MGDAIDRAQARDEYFRELALAAHRLRLLREPAAGSVARGPSVGPATLPPSGGSPTHCETCGDPIPQARREAVPGCRWCVECQEDRELRGR